MADQIPDDEKKLLQGMIDTLKFVDPAFKKKGFYCVACIHIAIDNCVANCGEPFCNACFTRHYHKRCPSCNKLISEKLDDAKLDFDKGVFKLKVECNFKKNGCKEIMQIGEFIKHRKDCKFSTEALLPKVYREDSNKQLKELTDEICQIKDKIKELEDSLTPSEFKEVKQQLKEASITFNQLNIHFGKLQTSVEIINKRLEAEENAQQQLNKTVNIKCEETNGLVQEILESVTRDKLKSQFESKLTNVERKLEEKGNQVNSLEKIFKTFDSDVNQRIIQRIDPLNDEIQKIKLQHETQLKEMKSQFDNELTLFKNQLEDNINESHSYIYTRKISDIGKHLQQWNQEVRSTINSDYFIIKSQMLKFKATLCISSSKQNIMINIEILNDSKLEGFCSSETFTHCRKYILLDQSERNEMNNLTVIQPQYFTKDRSQDINKSFTKWWPFIPLPLLKEGNPYIKNDCIIIKIILEPIVLSYRSVVSYNGILLWQIDNYSKKKPNEIDGITQCLTSKSFYTSQMGYRMNVRLYLNGAGEHQGKSLSIYLGLIQGEWDSFLKYPFKCKITFSILDQSESLAKTRISITYEKEFNYNVHSSGYANFAKISEVESSTYLKNDTILIKTEVVIL